MSTRWSPFTKHFFIIGSIIAVIWLAFRVHILWTPLIMVFILSFLVSYPVNAILRRTGWPRTLVVVIAFLLLLVLIGIAAASIVPRLFGLASGLAWTLRRVVTELAKASPKPIEITPTLALDVGQLYAPFRDLLTGILQLDPLSIERIQNLLFPFASGAAAVVIGAFSGVVSTLFVLVLSFYLVKDWPGISRYALTRAPEAYRVELRRLWYELASVWDAFARGQITAGLVMGMLVGLILSILGVRNGVALGLLAAVAELIPGIGPVVSALIGTLIALTFGSSWLPMNTLWFALLVLGIYLFLGQFQNLYVIPRAIGRRIDLHPVVIIAGALAGAELLGILGVLLAAPTIASLRVVFGYAFNKVMDLDPFPAARPTDGQKTLWGDLIQVRQVQAVLFDLDGTLIETDDVTVQRLAQRLAFLEKVLPVATRERTARQVLMSSEMLVNGLITLLDRLRMDKLLFRLNNSLHRWLGIRPTTRFVAVAGVTETLYSLASHYRLAVVTSRTRAEAQAFLTQYNLAPCVEVVISRDDTPRLKPHPAPVRLAAERLGISPEQCVMVGDTSVDMRAAKAAGALAVGVLSGFGGPEDFKQSDLVLDCATQLTDWLTAPPARLYGPSLSPDHPDGKDQ